MTQVVYGSGTLFAVMKKNAKGETLAVPQAVKMGIMQNVDFEFEFETKQLRGSRMFPIKIARSMGSVQGKIKNAEFNSRVWGHLVSGGDIERIVVDDQPKTVAASVSATMPGAATFLEDGGVMNAATGIPFKRVAATPAAGEYAVSGTGTYTFAAADVGKSALLTFSCTTASGGFKGTFKNDLAGYTPIFGVTWGVDYDGARGSITLPSVVPGSFSAPFSREDFSIPELAFEAFAGPDNIVGYWSTSE